MRILIQTSIPRGPASEDDWNVRRFSQLVATLREAGHEVTARDREPVPGNDAGAAPGDDPVLLGLARAGFDQVWLIGVDGGGTGEGLTDAECAAVRRFHEAGGGVLGTRDHANMGIWLRKLGDLGEAHFFHRDEYAETDPARRCADDSDNPTILYPNYHSGRNGDFQPIEPVGEVHPLLLREGGEPIKVLPAHPHEGAVACPGNPRSRPVARGRSLTTGRTFELLVAFERSADGRGRAVADSSFHHFADYNLDPAVGAPSFVTERPGGGMVRDPRAATDARVYMRNLAAWLAPLPAAM